MNKKIKILMVSLTSKVSGGPNHMFLLGEILSENFKIFYGLPNSSHYSKYLNKNNFLTISERKISLIDIFKILKIIKNKKIDILHAHGKGAGALLRIIRLFTNKPVIYTFHGIHINFDNLFLRIFYLTYENLIGLLDTHKIFVSNSEKIYASKNKIFVGKNFSIINNGVKNNKIKNFDKTNLDKEINVISVNRLVKQKNIYEIIRIASLLKEINFKVIGDGPLLNDIQNYIEEKQLRNINLLRKKYFIFDYLKSSSIFLSTSLYEGLPYTILEAMSVGLPIVASNVVGNCDTIEHNKSGYYYELGDIYSAVNYINKLASDYKLRKKMGEAAFKRQRELFSLSKMKDMYTKIYFDINNNFSN